VNLSASADENAEPRGRIDALVSDLNPPEGGIEMRRIRMELLLLPGLLLGVVGAARSRAQPPRAALVVETGWVEAHLKEANVRIVDMRSDEAYRGGHIPGAIRIAEGPLRDPNDSLDYLPRPEVFAEMMGKAGIGAGTHVVIYDDQGGRSAARFWFVLDAYGHEKSSLVNGGWPKWSAEERPTSTEIPRPARVKFTPKKVPSAVCAAPELLARKRNTVVLDTRSAAEYRGGRLPNAVNLDWTENVTGPYRVFKDAAELKKLYESKGVTPDKEVVTY